MAPRVALISGCSSGVGLTTAVLLAQDSAKGFIVYATMRNLSKKGDLEAAAGSALNDTLFVLELDVTKHDTIKKAVETIMQKHGRLDILTLPFTEFYVATKYALEGFSESIAASLRPFNIWVSTIQPGLINTNMSDNVAANNMPGFEQFQNENVDELSRQAIQKALSSFYSLPEFCEVETVESVAGVVKDVLTAEKPHFQNPTTKSRAKQAATKFVDPTNDTSVEYFAAACTPDPK